MRTLKEVLVMQYQHNPSNAKGPDCLTTLLLLPVILIVRAVRS
jgi:hypothetical protein